MYGYPPYPYWFPPAGAPTQPSNNQDPIKQLKDTIRFCKSMIAEQKRGEKKDGDKKKDDKKQTLTVSEMAGFLFFYGPFIVLGEIYIVMMISEQIQKMVH